MKKNVDQQEIHKFNEQAKDWWDSDGKNKALHAINPVRLAFIDDHASLSGKKVLDVGCGGGILSEAMAKAGAHVTGLDMSEEMIAVAANHAKKQNLSVDYQHRELAGFVKENTEQFDIVTCMEMLEHVPNPEHIVTECARALKPGGHCFFSTLNRTVKCFMLAIVGAEYVMNLIPRGTHEYAKFIKPSELASFARNAKLTLGEMKGLHYQPLTNKGKLIDSLAVNYLAHTKK